MLRLAGIFKQLHSDDMQTCTQIIPVRNPVICLSKLLNCCLYLSLEACGTAQSLGPVTMRDADTEGDGEVELKDEQWQHKYEPNFMQTSTFLDIKKTDNVHDQRKCLPVSLCVRYLLDPMSNNDGALLTPTGAEESPSGEEWEDAGKDRPENKHNTVFCMYTLILYYID